jgi:predicted XRE-type DNA-binding protein
MRNGRRNRKKATVVIESSSGNVFMDLDVPEPAEALAKAELARCICAIIAERKLSQVKAATLLGVDQPKMSALIRGKLDGFSVERLFRFLNALGQDVEIIIRRSPRNKERADTRVISA